MWTTVSDPEEQEIPMWILTYDQIHGLPIIQGSGETDELFEATLGHYWYVMSGSLSTSAFSLYLVTRPNIQYHSNNVSIITTCSLCEMELTEDM